MIARDLQELIVIPKQDALSYFTTPADDNPSARPLLEALLKKVRDRIDVFKPMGVATEEGREEIRRFVFQIVKSRTALKAVGDELAKDAKALPAKIDVGRRYARETLEAWESEVEAPLTAWKATEQKRIDKHVAAIASIVEAGTPPSTYTSEQLRTNIDAISAIAITREDMQEFADQYELAKRNTLISLHTALDRRVTYEDEQEELVRLRAEAAERKAADDRVREERERQDRIEREAETAAREAEMAADRVRREMEDRAAREREEALARETALREAAERAQREAAETEARVRREHEAAAQRALDEAAARERDRAHRGRINKAAVDALVLCGVNADEATAAIKFIAKGMIPNVRISY